MRAELAVELAPRQRQRAHELVRLRQLGDVDARPLAARQARSSRRHERCTPRCADAAWHTTGATSSTANAFLVTLARFGILAGNGGRRRAARTARAATVGLGARRPHRRAVGQLLQRRHPSPRACTSRWCARARAARAARRRSPGTTTCPSSVGCCSAESAVTAALPISWRYPLVELLSMLLALAVYARFVAAPSSTGADVAVARLAAHFLVYFAFVGTLVVARRRRSRSQDHPRRVTYPAIPAFFVAGLLLRDVAPLDLILGMAIGYGIVAVTAELAYWILGARAWATATPSCSCSSARCSAGARSPSRSCCRRSSASSPSMPVLVARGRAPARRRGPVRPVPRRCRARLHLLRARSVGAVISRVALASTKCSRSLPQNSSSPTNIVGAPNAPRAIASSVLARSRSLIAGALDRLQRRRRIEPAHLGDAPQLGLVGDVAIFGPHRAERRERDRRRPFGVVDEHEPHRLDRVERKVRAESATARRTAPPSAPDRCPSSAPCAARAPACRCRRS